MAPPSRPALTLKAAKKLDVAGEALLDITPTMEATLAASKANGAYGVLGEVINLLHAVKEMTDVGSNTYPTYPKVREVMIKAGNEIYRARQDVESTRARCLTTEMGDRDSWKQIGLELADIASRLRAVKFVPERGKKEKEAPSA